MRPRKGVPNRSKGARYSTEYKMKALQMLEINEMDVPKTAADMGLSDNILRRWYKIYKGEDVKRKKPKGHDDNMAIPVHAGVLSASEGEILKDVIEAKKVIIRQIINISRNSQNLDALQKTFKMLCGVDGSIQPETPQQNIINMINRLTQTFSYGTETIDLPEGDPEE